LDGISALDPSVVAVAVVAVLVVESTAVNVDLTGVAVGTAPAVAATVVPVESAVTT